MKLYIGADHRGFQLKNELAAALAQEGFEVEDCGNTKYEATDDYPDFTFAVAEKVAAEAGSQGIVICGSGVGVTVAANKVKGARCATISSVEQAVHAKENDNLNIIALAADYLTLEQAKEISLAFLRANFKTEEKYIRRYQKIVDREN